MPPRAKPIHPALKHGGYSTTTILPGESIAEFEKPHERFVDELIPQGARPTLAQVLIAEADAFVAMWKDLKFPDGRDRVVRHGHGPQRDIQTGIGPVEIRRAKVRDRGDVGLRRKFASPLQFCRSGPAGSLPARGIDR
jgi:hypothetical protein